MTRRHYAMTRIAANTQTTLMRELKTRLGSVLNSNKKYGVVLTSYSGPLEKKSGDSIVTLAEMAVLHSGGTRSEMKRVSNVLIECIQNVIRHGWIDEFGETFLHLTIEHNSKGYQIQCGNIVDLEMALKLKENLNEVNQLNPSEIRKKYVDVLCKVDPLYLNGVGLGLLSMAESCSGKLEYELTEKESEDLLLFYVTATVNR